MSDDVAGERRFGTLRAADGSGVVRIEDLLDSSVEDVWSALTDPARLARWYGEVTGELRVGGELRVYLEGPDLESTGRVEVCEPPLRLLVRLSETEESARRGGGQPVTATMTATLTPSGEQTILVVEVSGLPLAKLAAYGIGWHLHVESLAAYAAGRPGPDVAARWGELAGTYEALAADIAR